MQGKEKVLERDNLNIYRTEPDKELEGILERKRRLGGRRK